MFNSTSCWYWNSSS